MKKILLTSAGFENTKIRDTFMDLVGKQGKEIKVLFVTTAAIEVGAVLVLPKCLEDLFSCGIKEENIRIYDMHQPISAAELKGYDAIYVCGGKTSYLVDRMKEANFSSVLESYLSNGGIYIGVSAGSVAASRTYPNGLAFLPNRLNVHCEVGSSSGKITSEDPIFLTNNQAILITDQETRIIE